ncbi:MAG: hypothetical protein A2W91_13950 [Bacteroidetes bacterium GWF2_38_335]|nr:MAG: hypothetical protein A2W91_13950 [Bacteroidetes bacterium GWF2_38_335]OFY77817.1 MAG: hypothetical protein A2281_15640 [Bacteroidetes bacterium RIFOXYA12_FULL_38_20]HBS87375.1 hypothetical protein [Bacteroidales bacterium]
MYIRKTKIELRRGKNKYQYWLFSFVDYLGNLKPFKASLFTFIIVFFSIFIIEQNFGEIKGRIPDNKPNNNESISSKIDITDRFSFYVVFSASIALVIFILKYNLKTSRKLVCNKCNKQKYNDGKFKCNCGGKFYFIEQMKWVNSNDLKKNEIL